jgi:uncharacterized protein (TIGR02466 family)
MYIESWFATPIYFTKFDDVVLPVVQQELREVVDQTQDQLQSNLAGSHALSDPLFETNLFEDFDLRNFQQELNKHILLYAGQCSGKTWDTDDFAITASWITQNRKHSYAIPHSHGTSDVAGCYYFKTNERDGNIFFQNPNKLLVNSRLFNQHSVIEYAPEVGKLILFPGWLDHGVLKNTTTNTRISFSFNVRFKERSRYA